MVSSLALAFLLQTTGHPVVPICSLVTPAGDSVGFQILPGDAQGDGIVVSPTRNSVWPTATLQGSGTALARPPRGKSWIAFGDDDGLVLELAAPERRSRYQTATLARRDGRRPGVPVAYGFCEGSSPFTVLAPMDRTGDPRAIGAEIPAFDQRRWPDDRCGMVLSDGRRMPLRFDLRGPDEIEIASPLLWRARPFAARVRWTAGVGRFNGRNGLAGVQQLIIQEVEGIGAKIIRFDRLGDPAAQSAYAICGYTGIERRPTRQ